MKIINQYIIFLSLSCLMLLSSCFKDEIQLELNNQENKKVVISGWLNDQDSDQHVTVNYTSDYLETGNAEFINDALVTLSYNTETINLEHTTDGKYILPADWKGEIGTEYTLSVLHDEEEYQSVSLLRPMPEVENIRSLLYVESDSVSFYEIYFDFQETPGEGDGYFAIDYLKNSDQRKIISNGGWDDDDFADGEYYADITVTQNNHQLGDTIILEAHSTGIKATEYFQSISSEVFREGLLDPPPVNVSTNFSNGAVGYFITSGKKEYEIIVE